MGTIAEKGREGRREGSGRGDSEMRKVLSHLKAVRGSETPGTPNGEDGDGSAAAKVDDDGLLEVSVNCIEDEFEGREAFARQYLLCIPLVEEVSNHCHVTRGVDVPNPHLHHVP